MRRDPVASLRWRFALVRGSHVVRCGQTGNTGIDAEVTEAAQHPVQVEKSLALAALHVLDLPALPRLAVRRLTPETDDEDGHRRSRSNLMGHGRLAIWGARSHARLPLGPRAPCMRQGRRRDW